MKYNWVIHIYITITTENIEYKVITYPGVKRNMYMISNTGTIITIKSNKIRSQTKDKDGYLMCMLMCDSSKSYKSYPYRVHRLVAWEFCKNRDINKVVNHIDNIVYNNSASNLEWVSISENTRHGYEHGNCLRGEEHYKSKYPETTIINIIELINSGHSNKDIQNILTSNNIAHTKDLIKDIRRKKVWKWLIGKYNKEGSTTIEKDHDEYLYIDINLG